MNLTFHVQFFIGAGEAILHYNVTEKWMAVQMGRITKSPVALILTKHTDIIKCRRLKFKFTYMATDH